MQTWLIVLRLLQRTLTIFIGLSSLYSSSETECVHVSTSPLLRYHNWHLFTCWILFIGLYNMQNKHLHIVWYTKQHETNLKLELYYFLYKCIFVLKEIRNQCNEQKKIIITGYVQHAIFTDTRGCSWAPTSQINTNASSATLQPPFQPQALQS